MKKNRILDIVKWLWLLIVLLGAGYYFLKHRDLVATLLENITIWQFLLSMLLLLTAKALIGEITRLSVETEGWHPSYLKMFGIYSVTSLGKYVPGGIWHFVGRFSTYRLNQLSNKQSTKAMIVENVWMISSAVAVGCSFFCLFQFETVCDLLNIAYNGHYSVLAAALITALWVAGLFLFNRFFCTQNQNYLLLSGKIVLISVLVWIFVGLSFIMIFDDLSFKLIGLSIGGYALSWAAGYIAVFAPGGIGVRETVLAAVFSVIAPAAQIAVYAAMNRIVWVIVEVLLGVVFSLEEKDLIKQKDLFPTSENPLDPNRETDTSAKNK